MDKKPKSENPFLHRFDVVFSLLALIFSAFSLYISLRAERTASAPNIQLQRAEGDDRISVDVSPSSSPTTQISTAQKTILYDLRAEIELWNYGRAPAQIVDLSWTASGKEERSTEVPFELVGVANVDTWLAISDRPDTEPYKYRPADRFQPLENLGNAMIQANEGKTLYIQYHTRLLPEQHMLRLRLEFKLNDGRVIVATPMIRTSSDPHGASGRV